MQSVQQQQQLQQHQQGCQLGQTWSQRQGALQERTLRYGRMLCCIDHAWTALYAVAGYTNLRLVP